MDEDEFRNELARVRAEELGRWAATHLVFEMFLSKAFATHPNNFENFAAEVLDAAEGLYGAGLVKTERAHLTAQTCIATLEMLLRGVRERLGGDETPPHSPASDQ